MSARSSHSRVFLASGLVLGLATIAVSIEWRPLNTHTGYAPEQPVAYSHRLHAGELEIDCLYCHFGARTSPRAGIPPTSVCMNCHATVSSDFGSLLAERALAADEDREPRRIVSAEIRKVYAAMGLDDELQPTDSGPHPIPWVQVHDLPDFVAFDHSVHVSRGLACASCHGPVQSMERVWQESDLSMGWCVNCHRERAADPRITLTREHGKLQPGEHVTTDCVACHY